MAAQLRLCHMPEAKNSEWLQSGRERESCLDWMVNGMTPFSYRRISEVDMVQYWWFYVVVGLVLGMNVGYMFGIKRGSEIVGDLIAGMIGGFVGVAEKGSDKEGD